MAWTLVPKPTETSILGAAGDAEPIGLLIAITSVHSDPVASIITGWTDISNPTSSVWSLVAKPTS